MFEVVVTQVRVANFGRLHIFPKARSVDHSRVKILWPLAHNKPGSTNLNTVEPALIINEPNTKLKISVDKVNPSFSKFRPIVPYRRTTGKFPYTGLRNKVLCLIEIVADLTFLTRFSDFQWAYLYGHTIVNYTKFHVTILSFAVAIVLTHRRQRRQRSGTNEISKITLLVSWGHETGRPIKKRNCTKYNV